MDDAPRTWRSCRSSTPERTWPASWSRPAAGGSAGGFRRGNSARGDVRRVRGARDAQVLAALAEQAAVAVHTVVLARDVRRSRELAVSAREEERRRLYRDLHDGLGPALAALALQVETARDLVAVDADRAGATARSGRRAPEGHRGRGPHRRARAPAAGAGGPRPRRRPPRTGGRFRGPLSIDTTVDVTGDSGTELPAAVEVAAYRSPARRSRTSPGTPARTGLGAAGARGGERLV